MKRYIMLFQFVVALSYVSCIAYAQDNFPFPQNSVHPFGIMPEGRDSDDAADSYENWKVNYVTYSGAGPFRRVLWDDSSSTVSEGIGYGMLLSSSYGDKDLFDDLWGYYNLHLDKNGLMHWKIGPNGEAVGMNAATDADQDVAFALLIAHRQWGSQSYLTDAIDLINKILQHEVEPNTYVLRPGDVWGGSDVTNPSYFSPAYYRVFKEVTGNTQWDSVISKSYEILEKAANAETGLVPDWCKADGTAVSCETYPGNCSYDYKYDAVRTPFRIALDYLWFGERKARDFSSKIANFVRDIGIDQVVDGYDLDGMPIGQWHNSAFVGTFAIASMAADSTYQGLANESYIDNVTTPGDNYYNMSLRTLTLFIQTGNFNYSYDVATDCTSPVCKILPSILYLLLD